MGVGEWFAWVLLLLLALYGCAQLIRRLCLWFWRCKDVELYRVAVPRKPGVSEALLRCLEAQAAWNEGAHTYVLLPDTSSDIDELGIARLLAEQIPSVTPVDAKELYGVITRMTESDQETKA